MLKTIIIAASAAISLTAAVTAPAMADQYCGPGFYYRYHECRPYAYNAPPPGYYADPVGGAGYVAGSAVNAAGNVAGAAVGTAGAIVNGVFGR
jgi:hypothetical protein